MRFIFTTFLTFFIFNTSLFSQITPSLEWQFGMMGDNLGRAGLVSTDLENDGIKEIVVTGMQNGNAWKPESFFSILTYDSNQQTFITKRISNATENEITTMNTYDFDQDGTKEIFIGLETGEIEVYHSVTLEKTHTIITAEIENPFFTYLYSLCDIEFGDFDGDNQIDLLTCTWDSTYVFNHQLELKHKIAHGAKSFKIANIDEDIQTEIIYANGRIMQLNDDVIEDQLGFYTNNISDNVINIENMDSDGTPDIIYASRDSLYVLNYKSNQLIWSNKWELDSPFSTFYIRNIWLQDYNNDGTVDVFIADDESDNLYCYNGKTGDKEFSIKENGESGVDNLVVEDIDGDSTMEIIWTTGAGSSQSDYLYIHDAMTKEREWKSNHFFEGFRGFDVGDLKNDGSLEIAVGTYGTFDLFNDDVFLSIIDAEEKKLLWQNEEAYFGFSVDGPTALKIADINNDGKNEILVGVQSNATNSTRVYIFNENYEVIGNYSVGGMDIVVGIEVEDVDNDNQNEVIITAGTNTWGGPNWNNYIYIYDGKSGDIEWKSEKLGSSGSKIASIRIGDIDDDKAKEIIAMKYENEFSDDTSTLYIIDGLSHEFITEKNLYYTALEIADINNDGKDDLLAAIDVGKVVLLDVNTLEVLQSFDTSMGIINALQAYDLNNDGMKELIIANNHTLGLFDTQESKLKWQSNRLNSGVGIYNTMKVGNFDSDSEIEILVNATHALYGFEVNYESLISNIPENTIPIRNVNIYPNPTHQSSRLEITANQNTTMQMTIYDIYGQEAISPIQQKILQGSNTFKLDLSNLTSGIYNVSIVIKGEGITSKKIVKLE